MEHKMTILFIGKKSRITRHQLLCIYMRLTIERKCFEVATHWHVEPSEWSPSVGQVKGRSDNPKMYPDKSNQIIQEIK